VTSVERHRSGHEKLQIDDVLSGGIVPNGPGIAAGFPQILSDAPTVKAALRRRVRATRRLRTPAAREAVARALAGVALELPQIQTAHCVALYAATGTEPETAPLRQALRDQGIGVVLPLVRQGGLEWAWDTGDELRRGHGPGGGEPAGPTLGPRGLLAADVVLVPALAVDTLGTRLGQGGGHYDTALPLLDPGVPVLAVVHDDEVIDAAVEAVPAEPHDVPVDGALTPLRCLRLPGRS
jgi:5-formyltetrahydrofolate cyclo-ligase